MSPEEILFSFGGAFIGALLAWTTNPRGFGGFSRAMVVFAILLYALAGFTHVYNIGETMPLEELILSIGAACLGALFTWIISSRDSAGVILTVAVFIILLFGVAGLIDLNSSSL